MTTNQRLMFGFLVAMCVAFSNDGVRAQSTTNQIARPRLPIWEASKLTQAELEKRGLADKHFVSSIMYLSGDGPSRPGMYVVRVSPPIPIAASSQSSNESPLRTLSEFHVSMDGRVTEASSLVPTPAYRGPYPFTNTSSPVSLRRRILRQQIGTNTPPTVESIHPPIKVLSDEDISGEKLTNAVPPVRAAPGSAPTGEQKGEKSETQPK